MALPDGTPAFLSVDSRGLPPGALLQGCALTLCLMLGAGWLISHPGARLPHGRPERPRFANAFGILDAPDPSLTGPFGNGGSVAGGAGGGAPAGNPVPEIPVPLELPAGTSGFGALKPPGLGGMLEPDPEATAIDAVLRRFDEYPIVVLGERHASLVDSRFRIALVQHPRFREKVQDIVVEFANSNSQDLLDLYTSTDTVSETDLIPVWWNTSKPGIYESPIYWHFFRAVRDLNLALPNDAKKLRVWGTDPVRWKDVHSYAEWAAFAEQKRTRTLALLEREVFARRRRALVILGDDDNPVGHDHPLVQAIDTAHPKAVFVITPVGDKGVQYDELARRAGSAQQPLLIPLKGTAAGVLPAYPFLPGAVARILADRLVSASGEPFTGKRLADLADACLNLGHPTYAGAQQSLYLDPERVQELARRRRFLKPPPSVPLRGQIHQAR